MFTAGDVAAVTGGELFGDAGVSMNGVAPLYEAAAGNLTFVDSMKKSAKWKASPAAAAIVPSDFEAVDDRPLIRCAQPFEAFFNIIVSHKGDHSPRPGIHPTAVVDPSAKLGANASIGPGAVVGRNCILGDDVVLHARAVLGDDTVLGHRVVVHEGAVLGSDGFGYKIVAGKHVKIPQVGYVLIEDDVEIGANTTIDRGALGSTRIGEGTKIDNQVMIGHNCQIGKHNILCGQVGIAGSTVTGDYVVMGGQVGVADHVTIGTGTQLGAKCGVTKNIGPGLKLTGNPARPIMDFHRRWTLFDRLPDVFEELAAMRKRLAALEKSE